jgi:hypothetical protein
VSCAARSWAATALRPLVAFAAHAGPLLYRFLPVVRFAAEEGPSRHRKRGCWVSG